MIIEAFTMKKSSFNEIVVAPDAADLEYILNFMHVCWAGQEKMKWLRKLLQSRELQNTIKDSFVCPMLFAKKQAIFLVEFSD